MRYSSRITWEPPFSLDLTNIDPDIVYCVEVYNISCGERIFILNDCNITETQYNINDVIHAMYVYEITVIPRSNVAGALNGTPLVVEGLSLHTLFLCYRFIYAQVCLQTFQKNLLIFKYHKFMLSRKKIRPKTQLLLWNLLQMKM